MTQNIFKIDKSLFDDRAKNHIKLRILTTCIKFEHFKQIFIVQLNDWKQNIGYQKLFDLMSKDRQRPGKRIQKKIEISVKTMTNVGISARKNQKYRNTVKKNRKNRKPIFSSPKALD